MTTWVGAPYTVVRAGTFPSTDFRKVTTAIKAALDGCGLVQTSDTGQMDVTTVNWPGTSNTEAGYLIYRFNDSLQATYPIFIRIGIGRAQNYEGTIWYRITVGTGTNGAGTITGQTSSANINLQNSGQNSGGNTTDYEMACHTEGYAGYFHRVGHNTIQGPCAGIWSVQRIRDQLTGAFNGKGFVLFYRPENGTSTAIMRWQSVRTASPAATYTANRSCCLLPGAPTDTALLNGDKQLYPHFYNIPDIEQCWATFTVRANEFANSPTSFIAAPMYGQNRTFITLGYSAVHLNYIAANCVDSANWAPCFLWE